MKVQAWNLYRQVNELLVLRSGVLKIYDCITKSVKDQILINEKFKVMLNGADVIKIEAPLYEYQYQFHHQQHQQQQPQNLNQQDLKQQPLPLTAPIFFDTLQRQIRKQQKQNSNRLLYLKRPYNFIVTKFNYNNNSRSQKFLWLSTDESNICWTNYKLKKPNESSVKNFNKISIKEVIGVQYGVQSEVIQKSIRMQKKIISVNNNCKESEIKDWLVMTLVTAKRTYDFMFGNQIECKNWVIGLSMLGSSNLMNKVEVVNIINNNNFTLRKFQAKIAYQARKQNQSFKKFLQSTIKTSINKVFTQAALARSRSKSLIIPKTQSSNNSIPKFKISMNSTRHQQERRSQSNTYRRQILSNRQNYLDNMQILQSAQNCQTNRILNSPSDYSITSSTARRYYSNNHQIGYLDQKFGSINDTYRSLEQSTKQQSHQENSKFSPSFSYYQQQNQENYSNNKENILPNRSQSEIPTVDKFQSGRDYDDDERIFDDNEMMIYNSNYSSNHNHHRLPPPVPRQTQESTRSKLRSAYKIDYKKKSSRFQYPEVASSNSQILSRKQQQEQNYDSNKHMRIMSYNKLNYGELCQKSTKPNSYCNSSIQRQQSSNQYYKKLPMTQIHPFSSGRSSSSGRNEQRQNFICFKQKFQNGSLQQNKERVQMRKQQNQQMKRQELELEEVIPLQNVSSSFSVASSSQQQYQPRDSQIEYHLTNKQEFLIPIQSGGVNSSIASSNTYNRLLSKQGDNKVQSMACQYQKSQRNHNTPFEKQKFDPQFQDDDDDDEDEQADSYIPEQSEVAHQDPKPQPILKRIISNKPDLDSKTHYHFNSIKNGIETSQQRQIEGPTLPNSNQLSSTKRFDFSHYLVTSNRNNTNQTLNHRQLDQYTTQNQKFGEQTKTKTIAHHKLPPRPLTCLGNNIFQSDISGFQDISPINYHHNKQTKITDSSNLSKSQYDMLMNQSMSRQKFIAQRPRSRASMASKRGRNNSQGKNLCNFTQQLQEEETTIFTQQAYQPQQVKHSGNNQLQQDDDQEYLPTQRKMGRKVNNNQQNSSSKKFIGFHHYPRPSTGTANFASIPSSGMQTCESIQDKELLVQNNNYLYDDDDNDLQRMQQSEYQRYKNHEDSYQEIKFNEMLMCNSSFSLDNQNNLSQKQQQQLQQQQQTCDATFDKNKLKEAIRVISDQNQIQQQNNRDLKIHVAPIICQSPSDIVNYASSGGESGGLTINYDQNGKMIILDPNNNNTLGSGKSNESEDKILALKKQNQQLLNYIGLLQEEKSRENQNTQLFIQGLKSENCIQQIKINKLCMINNRSNQQNRILKAELQNIKTKMNFKNNFLAVNRDKNKLNKLLQSKYQIEQLKKQLLIIRHQVEQNKHQVFEVWPYLNNVLTSSINQK